MKKIFVTITFVCALAVAGCDGRTSQPLCKGHSNDRIEGISGVYDLNMREPDSYGVKTWKLKIMPGDEGENKNKSRNRHKSNARIQNVETNEEVEVQICNITGMYVLEAQDMDKKVAGFSQARLFITQVGLQFAPILFDKVALDAAGIPNKIVTIPDPVRYFLGDHFSTTFESFAAALVGNRRGGESLSLYIDNSQVPAEELLRASKPDSAFLTLYRE